MSAVVADLTWGLMAAGLLAVVAACIGAVLAPGVLARLHFLSPVTSLAGPLIGAALVLSNGWGLTAGADLLSVGLLALTGPSLAAATGRLAAQQQGLVGKESPE
jgi:multisubunit Na+/H+ antiporter MnhG subunit